MTLRRPRCPVSRGFAPPYRRSGPGSVVHQGPAADLVIARSPTYYESMYGYTGRGPLMRIAHIAPVSSALVAAALMLDVTGAAAVTAYDGAWNVMITTTSGTCDSSFYSEGHSGMTQVPLRLRNGGLQLQSLPYESRCAFVGILTATQSAPTFAKPRSHFQPVP
jgi:hypothetical protein